MSKANLLTKSVRVIAAIKPQKQATRRSNPTSSCFGAPKPEPRHNLKLDWGPVQHLAYYSCDESRNISFDFACLRAFRQPLIPTDLTRGQALFLRKNRRNRWVAHPTPLEHLTRACVALGKEAELYGADAVTRRGLLVRLMLGEYVPVKFYNVGKTLFLERYDPCPRKVYLGQLEDSYHGYSFEAACTQPNNRGGIIPVLDEWNCIVRRNLGDLNIIFGAEVDCVKGKYDNTSGNLMELKTAKTVGGLKRKKKCYLQSHLLGLSDIFIGYRDEDSILRKTERVPLGDFYIPQPDMLQKTYRDIYQIIHDLRAFCRNQKRDTGPRAWMVSVKEGRLLTKPELI